MKNKLKKAAVLVAVCSTLMVSLVACSKKGECELCGRETTVYKVTVDGESGWLCKSCKKLVDLFY